MNRIAQWTAVLAATTLAAAWLTGCGSPSHRSVDVVVLAPGSAVAAELATRAVADAQAAGADLTIAVLGSTEGSTNIVYAGSAAVDGNPVAAHAQASRQQQQLSDLVASTLARSQPPAVDILGGLLAIQPALARVVRGDTCDIRIASDMVSTGPSLALEGVELTPGASQELVAQVRAAGNLPQLHGCTVSVSGFGATGDQLDTQRTEQLRAFWDGLLSAAGAHVGLMAPYLVGLDGERA